MPNDPASSGAPADPIFFPTSTKRVRSTLASFALVAVMGMATVGVGLFGVSRGVEGSRFLRSSGDPSSLVILGGFFVLISLAGLVVYTRRALRRDAALGGLTLSRGGIEYDDEEKNHQSVPWPLVDSWRVTGTRTEPVIEVNLHAGGGRKPPEVISIPIHRLTAGPDEIIDAFTAFSGKKPVGTVV